MTEKPASPRKRANSAKIDIDRQSLQAELLWLKAHHDRSIHAHQAEVAALKTRTADQVRVPDAELESELIALRAEVQRMQAAEQRYLDRILELKDSLAAAKIPERSA